MSTDPQNLKPSKIWNKLNSLLDSPLGKVILIPAIASVMGVLSFRLSLPNEIEKAQALAKVKLSADIEAQYCDTLKKGVELIGKQQAFEFRVISALARPDADIEKDFDALIAENYGYAATLNADEKIQYQGLMAAYFNYSYESRHRPGTTGADLTELNLRQESWRNQQEIFKANRMKICPSS